MKNTAVLLIRAIVFMTGLCCFNKSLSCQENKKEGFEPFVDFGIVGMSVNYEQIAQYSDYNYRGNDFLKQFPLYFIPLPYLNGGCKYSTSKGIFSFNNKADLTLSPAGTGTGFSSSVSITPLFSLFANAHIETAWNYGSYIELVGVYNPAKKDYDKLTSFSEFSYGFGFGAVAIVPLPKKNIINLSYKTDYIAFSGAEDGEPWVCGTEYNCVNGWRYDASAMLAHTFNGPKLKMLGISGSASGIYDEDDFNKIYEAYNPGFRTYSISAISNFSLTERQTLMVMAKVSRNRCFELDKNDYEAEETLMQKYKRAKWGFDGIMIMWNIDLL